MDLSSKQPFGKSRIHKEFTLKIKKSKLFEEYDYEQRKIDHAHYCPFLLNVVLLQF